MKSNFDRRMSYFDKGYSAEKKKDYKKAISCYTQMIEVYPSDGYGYYTRAECYMEKGDYGKAIVDYTKAIRLNYKRELVRCLRATAYEENGEYDKAILDHTWLIRNDPNEPLLHLSYVIRADVYIKKHDYIHAWKDVTKAQKLGARIDPKSLNKLRRDFEKQRSGLNSYNPD